MLQNIVAIPRNPIRRIAPPITRAKMKITFATFAAPRARPVKPSAPAITAITNSPTASSNKTRSYIATATCVVGFALGRCTTQRRRDSLQHMNLRSEPGESERMFRSVSTIAGTAEAAL